MATEKEFDLKALEAKKESRIKLLKSICSATADIFQTISRVEDYDYYCVIERRGDRGIVLCWDEFETIREAIAFIAEFDY